VARGEGSVTVAIDEAELRAVLRAFNYAGKETSAELRTASVTIAGGLARRLRSAARSPAAPPQAALLAGTVTPRRDRIVTVVIGGARRVGRPYRSRATKRKTRAQAGQILWGSETGSDSGKDSRGRAYTDRFVRPGLPPSQGYWIEPTADAYGPQARREWWEAVEKILTRAGFTLTGKD
jgi:hypothetical protein